MSMGAAYRLQLQRAAALREQHGLQPKVAIGRGHGAYVRRTRQDYTALRPPATPEAEHLQAVLLAVGNAVDAAADQLPPAARVDGWIVRAAAVGVPTLLLIIAAGWL